MTFLGFISYKSDEKTQEHFFALDKKTHTFDSLEIDIERNKLDESFEAIKILLRPKKTIVLNKFWLQNEFHFSAENRILCNGFQSWTETDEYEINHKIEWPRKALKGIFKAFGDYEFVNLSGKKGDLHSWTYSFVRKKATKKDVLFFGSLNERSGYTLIRYETSKNLLFLAKDCEGLLLENEYEIADIFIAETNEQTATKRYFEAFYEKNPKIDTSKQGAEVGWTSWYNYYANIDEKIILDNLNAFASRKVPIDIFQIDDGWQEAVGDWTKVNKKFPNGLRYITNKIHENGYQAGLWLAPFICQKQSFIYKNHFDWLQKDEKGKPIKASFNAIWKSWMYPLDIYNKEVRAYLKEFFDMVLKDWNFDMVKLDFLYAVAFQPTKEKTRGQIMCEGIALLRELIGDKLILGCGVPLGPSLGMFNYCRIGADVHLSWEMNVLKWMGSRERVSTICALKNTVHRRHLNGKAFFNDPDVSILRSTKNKLTQSEKYTLFFLNQVFGALQFVSDNIGEYDDATLNLYLSQFPFRQKTIYQVIENDDCYEIYFGIGDLRYWAVSNLSEKAKNIKIDVLKQTDFSDFDANSLSFYDIDAKKMLEFADNLSVSAHETRCFLLSDLQKEWAIAGSSAHFFAGSEVESLVLEDNVLKVELYDKLMLASDILVRTKRKDLVAGENVILLFE